MFNETFFSGDLGGNFVIIKKKSGEEVNLHAYFDSGAFFFTPTDDFLTRPLNISGRTKIY